GGGGGGGGGGKGPPAASQLDPPLTDARDVEKVVDEADEMTDLALDHPTRGSDGGIRDASDEAGRAQDRRERVAQLVSQHGCENVADAVEALVDPAHRAGHAAVFGDDQTANHP